MKKVISLVLTLALVLALAVPAFATTFNVDDAAKMASGVEDVISGGTKVPAIKVTVPTTGGVVLNPYSMEVKIMDGAIDDTNGTLITSGDTVISPTYRITSESDVAINVNVSVLGEIPSGSEATFATATTHSAKAPTTKSVYLVMDFVSETAATAVATSDPTWNVTSSKDATSGVITYTGIDKTKNVVVSNKAQAVSGIAKLAKTDTTNIISAVAFHLMGDAASAPTSGWKNTDIVNVKTTFTFTATA